MATRTVFIFFVGGDKKFRNLASVKLEEGERGRKRPRFDVKTTEKKLLGTKLINCKSSGVIN